MTSQLEKDLERRCFDRFQQVIEDLFSLYDMAGLSDVTAARSIALALLKHTANMLGASEATPEESGVALQQLVSMYRKKHNASSRTR